MKENLLSRILKVLGIMTLIAGSFISVMKGLDRMDFFIGAEGVLVSLLWAIFMIMLANRLCVLQAKRAKETPDEEKTDAFYAEIIEKKQKAANRGFIGFCVIFAVFLVYIITVAIAVPFHVNSLIEAGKYEEAFDNVIKGKMTKGQRENYIEKLMPLLEKEYDKEKQGDVVLYVDGVTFTKKDNKLYMNGELLYEAGAYDVKQKARFDNDFIYSGGQILFIESLNGDGGHYKNVIAVDVKTKNHLVVDSHTNCYYMDKLKDGRILLSDEPVLVYDPFTGKISKKITQEEREYIYSTMG